VPIVGVGRSEGATAREPKVLIGGGTFLAPWNTAAARLSLAPIDVEATVRALRAIDGGSADGWEVALRVQAKIPAEARAVRAAAENLLGLGDDERRAYVRRAVEGSVPPVLARLRPTDGEPDWERLASEIQASVAPDLVTSGLVVRSVAVTELRRIGPAGRTDRTGESRRRPTSAGGAPDPAARHAETEPRLARVERGLRGLAADLARLLRDEPERTGDDTRWVGPAAPSAAALVHDSTSDGRAPGTVRPPWPTEPEADA
jgi:hypothetical protein